MVVDHFNYDSSSAKESHDVLLLPGKNAGGSKKGVADILSVDGILALPHAVGAVLGNASPLLNSIIKAPATAYTYNPKEEQEGVEDVFATGDQLSLVTAFQARNSARFTLLGSVEALQDAWFDTTVQHSAPGSKSEQAANRAFAQKLTGWTFKELGVVKAGPVTHFLNEGSQQNTSDLTTLSDINPSIYRINTEVHYTIELSTWSVDHWVPFTPPASDAVQLEFSMLSPFHRLNLAPTTTPANPNASLFTATFTLPDQHGIFNFFVEYRRPYLTNIEEKRTVTVRHFAHDEYPRSFVIMAAYPWITGIWTTVAGFVGFCALWLYSRPEKERVELKVKEAGGR